MYSKVTCGKRKFVPSATTILATLPTSPIKIRYEKKQKCKWECVVLKLCHMSYTVYPHDYLIQTGIFNYEMKIQHKGRKGHKGHKGRSQ